MIRATTVRVIARTMAGRRTAIWNCRESSPQFFPSSICRSLTVGPTLGSSSSSYCSIRSFASLSEMDIRKRLDEFQDLFVEARLCIEDVNESAGTKYFDDDAEAAQEAVQDAVDNFEQLIQDIEDPNEKNRILRGNGLKVEQLKGELELALKGGHDH